jgi:hypothetical protein
LAEFIRIFLFLRRHMFSYFKKNEEDAMIFRIPFDEEDFPSLK